MINLKNICPSPSIKTFTLYTQSFIFSMKNNYNTINQKRATIDTFSKTDN